MPMDRHDLVIEPTFRRAQELLEIANEEPEPLPEHLEGVTIRNILWSNRLQSEIYFCHKNERAHLRVLPYNAKLGMLLDTLDCSYAWGLEQEQKAVQMLGTLVKHHQLKMYLLTGMFSESSRKSNIIYIFRRLRPTLAISCKTHRCIAALCQHPIGYYQGTWAGVMCPTDEVVAHLQLMRADEHHFWKKSNQHGMRAPQAGV